MIQKTYSCGNQINFTEADYGKNFRCKKCQQIHSYPPHPDKAKRKKKKQTATLAKQNGLNKLWLYFLSLKDRFLSFFKQPKVKKRTPISGFFTTNDEVTYTISKPMTSLSLPIHLQKIKEELIQKAWRKEEGLTKLQLSPNQLSPPNWGACIKIMLQHAEKVAPQIAIPLQVPRMIFRMQGKDSGGTFEVDGEGYVTITIDSLLQNNYPAALAVLAHELCHYILGSNGIKRANTLANEELTDVCMFVLGFGDIFLKGHQAQPTKTYGYLKIDQYHTLLRSITNAWSKRKTSKLLNNKEEALEKWVISVVYRGNRDRYEDNYKLLRKKHPLFSKYDILDKIKYDYTR